MCGHRIHEAACPVELYLPGQTGGVWNAVGLDAALQEDASAGTLLLTTSIMDAAALWQAGHKNVTAIGPDNTFAEEHLRVLKGCGARNVLLVTSDDTCKAIAGQVKALDLRYGELHLSDAPNVASYVLKRSAEDLNSRLRDSIAHFSKPKGRKRQAKAGREQASAALQVDDIPDGFRLTVSAPEPGKFRCYEVKPGDHDTMKLKATVKALAVAQPSKTAKAPRFHIDTIDLYSARSRRTFAVDVAALYSVEPEVITADLNHIIQECESRLAKPKTEGPAVELTEKDRREAERFGRQPDLLDLIAKDFEKSGYIGEKSNVLLAYLAMTSRKMQNALALLILSGSGAGKSALQDTALSFCPPEDLIKLTSVTARALFYKNETSLKHKVLALEEVTGAEHAAYAIRSLISAGVLIIETTAKDAVTGKLSTVQNRVYGPTAVFQTTTNPELDPETRSRFIVTSIDESAGQTRAILDAQRNARTLEGFQLKAKREELLERHHAFQRLLRPIEVVNPYGRLLTYTDDRLMTRRDHPKYLDLIEAIAFIRQFQKPVRQFTAGEWTTDYIEVSLRDITLANELATEILGRSLDELNGPSRALLLLIEKMTWEMAKKQHVEDAAVTFTRRELREYTRWSDYQVRLHMTQIEDLEYIVPCSGRFGQRYRYRLLWHGEGSDGGRFMLDLKPIGQLTKEAALLGIADQPQEPCGVKENLAETLRKEE